MKHSLISLRPFLLVLLFTGCAIRLIAPYDEVTDRKVSDLQEKVSIKFTEWGREIPPIEKELKFYDETTAVLDILVLRNESIEKSEIIVESLKKVRENIQIIQGLHRERQLTLEVVDQVRPDLMAQFNAIQKLQMALKRADEK